MLGHDTTTTKRVSLERGYPKEYDMNSITFSGLSGRMVLRTGKVLVVLKRTYGKVSHFTGSMSLWVEVAVHEYPVTQIQRQD